MSRRNLLRTGRAKTELSRFIERLVERVVRHLVRKIRKAMRKCAYCKQPLGFGEVTRLNRRNYAHFSCFEEEDKKDEAAMFAVNLTYPSTPLDLWIERELLEEEAEKNGDKKGKVIPFRRAS